ncbi:MAG TPA: choice-of-anchor D domain-containing protein, partial [Terriglobales bacterium]|nr:choice-of-anchor D domain-containing protein [Terriglobales bacterium]
MPSKAKSIFTIFLLTIAHGMGHSQQALTSIVDTVSINGKPFAGSVTVTWNFPGATNLLQATAPIANGNFTMVLVPSSTGAPGSSYQAEYRSIDGTSWKETWIVPPSTVPLTISQVRTATTLAGATNGSVSILAAPQVALSKPLDWGKQALGQRLQQTITLRNTGTAFLSLATITTTGPNASDFSIAQNCGTVVPSGGSCSITVTFTPSILGPETAAVSIVDSAPGSPHTVSLTGTGQNLITSGGLTVSFSATVAQDSGTVTLSSNRPVNFSLVSGSSGTLTVTDSTHAKYTAPASIPNQNVMAGCPVLPNDSVFNTRIDNLPVNANNAIWTSAANTGTNGLGFDTGWGTSVVDNTVPLTNEIFYYTGGYNGSWLLPFLPELKREVGTYVTDQNGSDHHILAVNKDTCQFWEVYNNYFTPRPVKGVNYTATSGYSYNGLSYGLPTGGATDAAGLPLGPLTLHLDEIKNGAVHHALRFTLAGGFIYGNPNSVYWPATSPHFANCCTNSPPYGARFRLKASYDISKFSAMAQAILTGLKQYGMILADAGTGPAITADTDLSRDPSALGALGQISNAHITLANFEAVDESSLMVNAKSSQVNPTNAYVQPAAFAVVNATDQSNSNFQVNYPVALLGVNIGFPDPILYVAAGSYSFQLSWWVKGSSNQNVTWSIVSGVGSVTPDGLYTPPATVSGPTSAVLQATSAADPNAAATQYITVIPTGSSPAPGTIRINSGGAQTT